MKKTLIAALLLVFCFLAPPVSTGADKADARPEIVVISDAPQASPMFVRFFYFFNQALVEWWQSGGRTATRGKWTISASEFYDEALQPRGVTIIITRFDPPRRMILNRQLTDGRAASNGKVASNIVIAVIKTTTEEGQK